jgi:puromycin-sensitive aminopeptidase
MSDNPHRLPRTVTPRHYRIQLQPDLEQFVFRGSVVISLTVHEATSTIVMNAAEIDIQRAALVGEDGAPEVERIEYDEAMQRVSLHLAEELVPGEAELDLTFTGILNDQLHGFYRSSYTDVDGVAQVIATTQFEATEARRAFPCFDEPDFKATYGVTLVVPEELFAVSNGAEVSRVPTDDGTVAVTFADTMKMSTYLVAFVVGPFEATEPLDVDGIPLRIIAPRGRGHLTDFALEASAFCLRYLADYYGIAYPGDKVDMVAIPDFAFGAMENLGCITYRETALLVDPATATQAELVRVLDVIGHELAHMWFGDLVTMEWWDGIWLNEAFASFMEMKATHAMRPQWKRWLSFSAVERPWAFAVDALASTRPVEFEVGSPEEANEMFDALTYGKGSAVLRMIEQYLGEEVFRQGVGNYLREHAYANTVTADLWDGLDGASGTDVGAIMDTWILQGGYPQVEARLSGATLHLSQRRYLSIPDETDQTVWKIPVQVRGEAADGPFSIKLLMEHPDVTVELPDDARWVVANAGGHGFYRVTYDEALATRLVDAIPSMEDQERFVLIDDTWAMVESGQSSVSDFLRLAQAYEHETEHAIWAALVGALGSIRHHVVNDADLDRFRSVVADLTRPAAERLGWEPAGDEPDLTRRLRGLVLGARGRLAEDPDTIERSSEIAERWIADPSAIDPDVGQSALFTWAGRGDRARLDRLEAAYREASNPQTELKLLQAMASVDDAAAVDRMYEAILDSTVRSQDAAWIVARMLGGRSSGPHAWRTLRGRWAEITARMPPMTLRRLTDGLPALSRPDVAADVAAYFAETEVPAIAKALAQNLEKLRMNTLLREREAEAFSSG